VNSPVVIGTPDLAKLYGVDSMPVTLLIDREGKTADLHSGVVTKYESEREIQTLLQERAK
jgi:hypothetical protein